MEPTIILITGMSGTGKSSTLDALSGRGWQVIDTDDDGWTVSGPDGDPIWDECRIGDALDAVPPFGQLALAGTVPNQGVFRSRFTAVVLLTAPLETMLHRVATRTTNPFGSTHDQRAKIVADTAWVLPLLRASADLELDTSRHSIAEVADRIEAFVNARRPA
ncbi:MAG: AAA family ATPase [Thermomicrobiales bacterium]